jgi:hypothetical protein
LASWTIARGTIFTAGKPFDAGTLQWTSMGGIHIQNICKRVKKNKKKGEKGRSREK